MGIFENPVKRFFSPEEEQSIIEAISKAELQTSGEIRVHLENHCRQKDPVARAAKLFHKLKMDQTALRNGVLVYLAVADHRFAIYADEGINAVVPEHFWRDIAADMQAAFKQGAFLQGLQAGIESIGQSLQEHFPRQENDENELPDEISYS